MWFHDACENCLTIAASTSLPYFKSVLRADSGSTLAISITARFAFASTCSWVLARACCTMRSLLVTFFMSVLPFVVFRPACRSRGMPSFCLRLLLAQIRHDFGKHIFIHGRLLINRMITRLLGCGYGGCGFRTSSSVILFKRYLGRTSAHSELGHSSAYDSFNQTGKFSMPLPKLSDAQIVWVSRQVAGYIDTQRQTYRSRAVPLDRNQKTAVQSFFPAATLDSARVVVLAGERIGNPPFYGELIKMGFALASLPDFAQMAAITYVDTVVLHEPFTGRVLFHELVHVLQYEKLGLEQFTAKYVSGFLN